LEIGEEKLNSLDEGIKENTVVVKEATKETKSAIEALKKNKDTIFLGAAVIIFLVDILCLIVL